MSDQIKVLITGASGLVGHAVTTLAPANFDLIGISSKDADLSDYVSCYNVFNIHRPTYVIHLAAHITYLSQHSSIVGETFFKNTKINLNVLECCRVFAIQKVVNLLSSVMYCNKMPGLVDEASVQVGEPDAANFGYAYAKRMLEVQSRAYNQQYGTKFVCLIPNSIYGPNDNFHHQFSRVIPGIIRKVHDAYINHVTVKLWGDGSPIRQFTYSADVARAIWWCVGNDSKNEVFNVSSSEAISIRDVAKLVCNYFAYNFANIEWNGMVSLGQKHTQLNSERLTAESGLQYTTINEGIRRTMAWYLEHYPNIRGVIA